MREREKRAERATETEKKLEQVKARGTTKDINTQTERESTSMFAKARARESKQRREGNRQHP